MRLTLRTMLAYLDDILDPADAQQIEQKIKESEFASGLVHRIRGSMRKLRLGAPRLEGKGLGLDSNTVAEYLDNTLTSDRVPDFEKVCLESDIHLAEVASCHQILTLVLGEPAEIPVELRERMYRVPDEAPRPQHAAARVTSTALDAMAATRSPAADFSAEKSIASSEQSTHRDGDIAPGSDDKIPAKQGVPDYLSAASGKRALPLVATVLLLFLALSIAIFAIGPRNVAKWLGGAKPVEVADEDQDPTKRGKPAEKFEKPAVGKPVPVEKVAKADDKVVPVAGPTDVSPEAPTPDSSGSATTKPDTNDDGSPAVVVDPDVPANPATGGGTDNPTNETPVEGEAATPEAPVAIEKPAAEKGPVDVGRFLSEKQILGLQDPKTGVWQRLAANSQLMSNDRLIVLPAYRPQLAFSSGVQLTLAGPAACTLMQPDENGTPGLEMDYGWAMVMTVNKPNAQFHVNLAGSRGTITFIDTDSAAAFDVHRYLAPGENPETAESQPVVQIIATHGKIHWRSDEGESIALNASGIVVLTDGKTTPGTLNVLPTWLESTALDGIDEIASESLEPLVPAGRSIELSLEEQVEHKNVELRMFAARSLMYLDRFDAFVRMLSDERNKSFWRKHLDAVKHALARGPESASAVRIAFEKIRGEKAKELFRLTWGYSPSQLANGDDARLVEYLRHEDLDVRLLAWENLWRITGRTGLYRPDGPERTRTTRIRYWEERQDNREIVYRTPPVPSTLIPLE